MNRGNMAPNTRGVITSEKSSRKESANPSAVCLTHPLNLYLELHETQLYPRKTSVVQYLMYAYPAPSISSQGI